MRNELILSSDDDENSNGLWDIHPKKEKEKFKPIHTLLSGNDIPKRVFDKNTKSYKSTFTDHKPKENIYQIQFSSCGQYLLTASTDNTLKLWDMNSLKGLFTYNGAGLSSKCIPKFACDDEFIFCGGDDGGIYAWETFKGSEPNSSGNHAYKLKTHNFPIRTISIDPQDETLVSGDESGQLQIKYLY